jgi:hypothetical protein
MLAWMSDAREVPKRVIAEAMRDPFIAGFFGLPGRLEPIAHDGEVVGFYRPHVGIYGRQIGPIFVMPTHRKHGLALAVYNSIDGQLYARIDEENVASVRLHERAMFTRWKRRGRRAWYWKRD